MSKGVVTSDQDQVMMSNIKPFNAHLKVSMVQSLVLELAKYPSPFCRLLA
jgi:hypothetical protein